MYFPAFSLSLQDKSITFWRWSPVRWTLWVRCMTSTASCTMPGTPSPGEFPSSTRPVYVLPVVSVQSWSVYLPFISLQPIVFGRARLRPRSSAAALVCGASLGFPRAVIGQVFARVAVASDTARVVNHSRWPPLHPWFCVPEPRGTGISAHLAHFLSSSSTPCRDATENKSRFISEQRNVLGPSDAPWIEKMLGFFLETAAFDALVCKLYFLLPSFLSLFANAYIWSRFF